MQDHVAGLLGAALETDMLADYKLPDNLRIDAAYMTDQRPVMLEQDGATWTVDLNSMTQVNDATATTRKMRRSVVVSERTTMG